MFAKMFLLFVVTTGVSFAQWNKVENFPVGETGSVYVDGDTIYAGNLNRLYSSTDGGISWIESAPFVDDETSFTSSIIKYENRIFVSTYNGIYETSDNGSTWTARNSGLNETGAMMINDLEVRGDSLYAATEGAAIFVLNLKGGDTWLNFRNGLDFGVAWNTSSLYNMNGTLLTGAGGSAFVYSNSPDSDQWIYHAYDVPEAVQNYMLDFIEKDGVLLGASTLAEYRSTDGGETWQKMYLGAGYVGEARFVSYGSKIYLFLGKLNGAFYFSTENLGETWELIESQHETYVPYDFTVFNNKFYTAGYDGLFYKEMNPTSVDKGTSPKDYVLYQNYPNPFNPVTSMQYTVGNRQLIIIKVYDLLGKEVATLVNEEKPAGKYNIRFDASGLSSGVYYYRLTAGNFSETKKMIVMK